MEQSRIDAFRAFFDHYVPTLHPDECWPGLDGAQEFMRYDGTLYRPADAAHLYGTGESPSGLFLSTKCKNPHCYNPAHVVAKDAPRKPRGNQLTLTQEEEDQVVLEYMNNPEASFRSLSSSTGLSVDTVRRALHRNGINTSHRARKARVAAIKNGDVLEDTPRLDNCEWWNIQTLKEKFRRETRRYADHDCVHIFDQRRPDFKLSWMPSDKVSFQRAAYAFAHGFDPGPKALLTRTCNNPKCINADHLRLT